MTRIISRVYLDFHATAGIKLRILPHISYQYRVVLLIVDHKSTEFLRIAICFREGNGTGRNQLEIEPVIITVSSTLVASRGVSDRWSIAGEIMEDAPKVIVIGPRLAWQGNGMQVLHYRNWLGRQLLLFRRLFLLWCRIIPHDERRELLRE